MFGVRCLSAEGGFDIRYSMFVIRYSIPVRRRRIRYSLFDVQCSSFGACPPKEDSIFLFVIGLSVLSGLFDVRRSMLVRRRRIRCLSAEGGFVVGLSVLSSCQLFVFEFFSSGLVTRTRSGNLIIEPRTLEVSTC